MSGICGIIHFDGRPVDSGLLHGMAQSMAHRGPAGIHDWVDGGVGLAHLALHTTPEAQRERQPLVSRQSGLTLVAEARIDNRQELIPFLTAKSLLEDQASTDASLILAAYEAWGEACPEHLQGDFAFAIWDTRQQRLFCARDRFGVRAFYYHLLNHSFAFATEVKALLSLPWVSRQLNEARIMMYLSNRHPWDKVSTFYKGILGLAPAHSLIVQAGHATPRRYWALDPQGELRLPSDQAYAEAFSELFNGAVRCRLRACAPVGAALSGGMDSSSVVCVARQLLEGQDALRTYSFIFDEVPESNERPYIQAVLDQGGCQATLVHGDQTSPFTHIEQMTDYLDAPLSLPNLFLHWEMYQAARQHGVGVFLHGFGGDQVVSYGLGRLTELVASGHWLQMAQEAVLTARRLERPWWWYFYLRGLRPWAPASLVRLARRLQTQPGRQPGLEASPMLNPHFARRHPAPEESLNPPASARQEHWEALSAESDSSNLQELDVAGAAFGLDTRYPFFDAPLVEFCLSLPSDQKLRQGFTRFILRNALQGVLPEAVRWRAGKANVSPNFKRQLFTRDHLLLEHAILEGPAELATFVQVEKLGSLMKSQSPTHDLDRNDIELLWKSAALSLWMQKGSFSAKD